MEPLLRAAVAAAAAAAAAAAVAVAAGAVKTEARHDQAKKQVHTLSRLKKACAETSQLAAITSAERTRMLSHTSRILVSCSLCGPYSLCRSLLSSRVIRSLQRSHARPDARSCRSCSLCRSLHVLKRHPLAPTHAHAPRLEASTASAALSTSSRVICSLQRSHARSDACTLASTHAHAPHRKEEEEGEEGEGEEEEEEGEGEEEEEEEVGEGEEEVEEEEEVDKKE